jgi:hypothetical protein
MATQPRVHLIKLCVGAEGIDDLATWQADQRALGRWGGRSVCTTRSWPKQAGAVLNGGSLYWVFRGLVLARQRVLAFEPVADETGAPRCGIVLDDAIVKTEAQPCRPFQGWRYLTDAKAPRDLAHGELAGQDHPGGAVNAEATLPASLRAALAELGVMRRRA